MGTAQSHSSEELIVEEIRRMVTEAVSNGGIISTADCVAQIKAHYPMSGFSRRHIADEVMMAAAAAGVAVEIGPVMREVQKRRTQATEAVSEEMRAALREHLRARLSALRNRLAGSNAAQQIQRVQRIDSEEAVTRANAMRVDLEASGRTIEEPLKGAAVTWQSGSEG